MAANPNLVLAQAGGFVRSLSGRQRMLLAGSGVAVAITLFVFVRLMTAPEMKILYSGMTVAEAKSMGDRLAAKNVKYEIAADGSIRVPADQLDGLRMEMASQGLPQSGRLGFEIFDKVNWTGSEFGEKVNFQRALEGELERTIGTLRQVEAARVHLTLPQETLFSERETEAKAAVVLQLRGKSTPETTAAIQQLVASAVDHLRPENVTVVDAASNRPLHSPASGPQVGGSDLENDLQQKLVATLEPVIGAGRVRAGVRVEYELSTQEETQENYDPNSAVAITLQRSEEKTGAALAQGFAGTASNLPNTATQPPAKSALPPIEGQGSRSESGSYVVNKSVRHTMNPPGRIRRVSAAVLVDDNTETVEEKGATISKARKRSPEEMKHLEELAKAALGLDAARGDTVSVQNLAFHAEPAETPAPPAVEERVAVVVNRWSSLLRYAGIGLLFAVVYFVLLSPLKKQTMAALRQAASPAGLPGGGAHAGAVDALAAAELPGAAPELKRTLALKQQLVEKVKQEPASAGRLVQSWMRQGEVQR